MSVSPYGGSGTEEGRDGWCTPRWLAEVIGLVSFDPCSNVRSHISAGIRIGELPGYDGLYGELGQALVGDVIYTVQPKARVFVNPPYARGQVIRWVRHYAHTNFIFLLRWAPDTVWFGELWPKCWGAWFPRKCEVNPSGRINFEPPPGVETSSNPFPHALYLRSEPAGEFLDRLLATGYLVRNERQRGRDSVNVPTSPTTPGGTSAGGAAVAGIGAWLRCAQEAREAAEEPLDFPKDWLDTIEAARARESARREGAGAEGSPDLRGAVRVGAAGEAGRGEVGAERRAGEGRVRLPRRKVPV